MYILISSLIAVALLVLMMRRHRKTGRVHAVIFLVYTLALYIQLYFSSEGGSGLMWVYFLLMLTWIHIVIIGLLLLFKKRSSS